VARCLECLGFIALAQAQDLRAGENIPLLNRTALLFGKAEALRRENRAGMTPLEQAEYDQHKAELEQLYNKTLLEAAWHKGRETGLDELMVEIQPQNGRLG